MKQILTSFKILTTIALLALAIGCANTAEQRRLARCRGLPRIRSQNCGAQQKLKALPHDKVTMVQENGKTYYVFPDAAHNQAYVGGPNQFETYRQLRLKQKEKVEAAEMNLDASTDWGFGASGLGSYSGRVP